MWREIAIVFAAVAVMTLLGFAAVCAAVQSLLQCIERSLQRQKSEAQDRRAALESTEIICAEETDPLPNPHIAQVFLGPDVERSA